MTLDISENGITIYEGNNVVVCWSTEEYIEDPETVVPAIANAIMLALTDPEKLKSTLLAVGVPADAKAEDRITNIINNNGFFFVPAQYKLALNTPEFLTLMEAYRRKNCMGKNHTYTDWLGLGAPYQYRNKYFKAHGTERPRTTNWYVLTDAGIEKLKEIEAYIGLPTSEQVQPLNALLFNLPLKSN